MTGRRIAVLHLRDRRDADPWRSAATWFSTSPPQAIAASGSVDPFVLHRVRLGVGSALDAAVLPGEPVQSGRHQAVGRLGDSLVVAAEGEDGIVEAVVHEDAPITGVQWHPEHIDAPAGQLTRLLRRLESRLS